MTVGSYQRRSDTFTCAIYCMVISIYISLYASKELNVIYSGLITLVITISVKILRVTQGYPFQAAYTCIVSRDMYINTRYGPKRNCDSRKQHNYTTKSSHTKHSVTYRGYLAACLAYNKAQKNVN